MASALQNSSLSKKRRFQPPITSYFVPCTPETEELSHHSYAAPTNTPTPALPANILSSLLGVGARVRKSVPEGYKTEQKKLTAYTVPTKNISSGSKETQPGFGGQSTTTTTTLYAGLEPFCGIHKIGNYAVQTFPRPDEQYRNEMMMGNADELSLPSGSQESNASSSSTSSFYMNSNTNNKRAYDPDLEDEDYNHNDIRGGFASGDIWQDTTTGLPASVYTSTPSSSHTIPQRTILSPRLGQHRRRIAAAASSTGSSSWKISHSEQENEDPLALTGGGAMPSGDMMDLDDFGEASFLRRREEVDADYFLH